MFRAQLREPSDLWWSLLDQDRLSRFWQSIVNCGIRAMGTSGASHAVDVIENCLDGLPLTIERREFKYRGWKIQSPVSLSLLTPEPQSVMAEAFLGSASTSGSGFRGRVMPEPPAQQRVWDMYTWDRWRVVPLNDPSGRTTIGYITGRPGGAAIPQLLSAGALPLPHFIIGEPDTTRFRNWQSTGVEIIVEGQFKAEITPEAVGLNLSVLWQPPTMEPEAAELLLCAHYDTVYTTVGAYDNATGCALLLELIHVLSQLPIAHTRSLPPIRCVWFGAEELDLGGSRAYVRQRRVENSLAKLFAVLNLDGLGRGNTLDIWAGPESFAQFAWDCASDAIRNWPHNQSSAGSTSTLSTNVPPDLALIYPPPPGSDHAAFYEAGIPAIMLTFNDQPILHQAVDTYDSRMLTNMVRTGRIALSMIKDLCEMANGSSAT